MRNLILISLLFFFIPVSFSDDNAIRLIIRGDDMGSTHAANEACIKTYKEGIVRSVEIMSPAPWFNEAVEMLKKVPGLDIGVHLTLTSEWQYYKWGPLTNSPSLVDSLGHFFPMTSQRDDFPPNTGFLQCGYKLEEVEKELRAQIELAMNHIPQVSHLTSHMGTPTSSPKLRNLTLSLAKEYGIPLELPNVKRASFDRNQEIFAEKEAAFIDMLNNLEPGLWLFVEHPALDTPEMRSLGHKGYWNVAQDRDEVTRLFTSEKIKQAIRDRGIILTSYAEALEMK